MSPSATSVRKSLRGTTPVSRPTLAILPWGLVFEDYLDPLGLTVDEFFAEISGGWLFNYVGALRAEGIESTIFIVSSEARQPIRGVHASSGARYVVVPAPARLRWIRPLFGSWKRLGARATSRPETIGPGTTVPRSSEPAQHRRGVSARVLFWDSLRRIVTPSDALARAIRKEGCHGILCQEYEDVRFDACVGMGRDMGVPVFATFQGGVPRQGTRPTSLRRDAMRTCAGLIIGSSAEAERVRQEYVVEADRLARIPNPVEQVDVNLLPRVEARAALGLAPDVQVVGWHGRVARWAKGLDLLVEAWRQLDMAPDRGRLLLVGSGRDADWLRNEIAPELESGSIVWIDRFVRDRSELFGFLAAAEVYAFPSRHEGFPVAPLEAMALGLPVVAGDARGVDEILEVPERDGGIHVRGEDPEALAHALRALLEDPVRARRLGMAARRRMEAHFSVPAIGGRLAPWLRDRGFPRAARATP